MLKQLLQAIIDRIKPCEHEWELLVKIERNASNLTYWQTPVYKESDIYRCKKCGKTKVIDNK